MKIENISVMNFRNAIRGARNPLESWDLSDSYFNIVKENEIYGHCLSIAEEWVKQFPYKNLNDMIEYFKENCVTNKSEDMKLCEIAVIGPRDMTLCQRLIYAGNEHRKFMRQILVSMDVTAPLYLWKELDKYQIGTVTNSCSTMHKLKDTPITLDCFEIDDYSRDFSSAMDYVVSNKFGDSYYSENFFEELLLPKLEDLRLKYLETKDKKYWKELIRFIPESWLQKRTMTLNYEVLYNICKQRKNHRLSEWDTFINYIKDFPYAQHLLFI